MTARAVLSVSVDAGDEDLVEDLVAVIDAHPASLDVGWLEAPHDLEERPTGDDLVARARALGERYPRPARRAWEERRRRSDVDD